MSSSEWISISVALVGFSFAFWVSWIFYRAQQKTDFGSLVQKLSDLKSALGNMLSTMEHHQKINEYGTHQSMLGVEKLNGTIKDHSDNLADIKSSILSFQREIEIVSEKIDRINFDSLISLIEKLRENTNQDLHAFSNDIKQKVSSDLDKIENQINFRIESSYDQFMIHLSSEISRYITDTKQQEDLIKHISVLMKDLSLSISSNNSHIFESMAKSLSASIGLRESASRNSFSEEVDDLQKVVRSTANQLVPYQDKQDNNEQP